MATTVQLSWTFVFLLLLTIVPGVRGNYEINLAGLVVASAVAFIIFAVIIAMIVVGLTWNSWYPSLQHNKGKVKMPKEYWRKKKEAKMKVLNSSRASRMTTMTSLPPVQNGLMNGAPSHVSRFHDTEDAKSDEASWVQGWTNSNPPTEPAYEEMALVMEMGEEKEEEEPEFRIETTIVDDETLDLGPFKSSDTAKAAAGAVVSKGREAGTGATSEQTATMEMEDELEGEAYVYTRVNRPRQMSTSQTPPPTPPPPPADEQAPPVPPPPPAADLQASPLPPSPPLADVQAATTSGSKIVIAL